MVGSESDRNLVMGLLKSFLILRPIIFLLGSFDHITVVTADGKLALNQIGQISMKSPQLILVNMASFPEVRWPCQRVLPHGFF